MNRKLLFIIVISIVLNFLYLEIYPGLNSDVAFRSLVSLDIIHNHNFVLDGGSSHTGALNEYLRIPGLILFGNTLFGLRFHVAIFNVLSIVLFYSIGSTLFNKKSGLLAALIFCFSSWTIYMRVGWKPSLFVFIMLLGISLLLKKNLIYSIFAAFILGLGSYNHSLFLIVPLLICIYWFLTKGIVGFFNKKFFIIVLFFLVGFSPRLILMTSNGEGMSDGVNSTIHAQSNLYNSFFLFDDLIDGKSIYLRFTGNLLLPILPFNSFLFVAALVYCLLYGSSKIRSMSFCFLVYFPIVSFFIPVTAIHYFLIPLGLTPFIIAYFSSKLNYRLLTIILTVFCLLNVIYIGGNFFFPYMTQNDKITIFKQGNDYTSSQPDIRTDLLYSCLLSTSNKGIAVNTPNKIMMATDLAFYDYNNQRLILNQPSNELNDHYYVQYANDYNKLIVNRSLVRCGNLKNFVVLENLDIN